MMGTPLQPHFLFGCSPCDILDQLGMVATLWNWYRVTLVSLKNGFGLIFDDLQRVAIRPQSIEDIKLVNHEDDVLITFGYFEHQRNCDWFDIDWLIWAWLRLCWNQISFLKWWGHLRSLNLILIVTLLQTNKVTIGQGCDHWVPIKVKMIGSQPCPNWSIDIKSVTTSFIFWLTKGWLEHHDHDRLIWYRLINWGMVAIIEFQSKSMVATLPNCHLLTK